jgi:hypothetical protein
VRVARGSQGDLETFDYPAGVRTRGLDSVQLLYAVVEASRVGDVVEYRFDFAWFWWDRRDAIVADRSQ